MDTTVPSVTHSFNERWSKVMLLNVKNYNRLPLEPVNPPANRQLMIIINSPEMHAFASHTTPENSTHSGLRYIFRCSPDHSVAHTIIFSNIFPPHLISSPSIFPSVFLCCFPFLSISVCLVPLLSKRPLEDFTAMTSPLDLFTLLP